MCNYLILLPVCPTCLRLRRDGPPTDPLISDPTPMHICDKALASQRVCHFNAPDTPPGPETVSIVGSEQCSMCEQANAQRYLPSSSSREMQASGLAEELAGLTGDEWPHPHRGTQVAGSQGHVMRVIWERQRFKREAIESGGMAPVIQVNMTGPEMPMVEFSGGKKRKEEQMAYFKNLYGASVYADRLPDEVLLMDVTLEDAELQFDSWAKETNMPIRIRQSAQDIFRKHFWRRKPYRKMRGIFVLTVCVGLASVGEGPTQSLRQLADMASLEDFDDFESIFEELKAAWLASQGEKPPVLKKGSLKVEVPHERQVHFRQAEEGDLVTISPLKSAGTNSPGDFVRPFWDVAMEEIYEVAKSDEKEESLKQEFLKQFSNEDTVDSDLEVESVAGSGSDKADTAQWIFDLAELPPALFKDPRKCKWELRDDFWWTIFRHRSEPLKDYDKVKRPKFPDDRWFQTAAFQSAVMLMKGRQIFIEAFDKCKTPHLPPKFFECVSRYKDQVLAGHIRLAIELQARVKEHRTETDMIEYLAHLLAISNNISVQAARDLTRSDVEGTIVPIKEEWNIVQRYRKPRKSKSCRSEPPLRLELEGASAQGKVIRFLRLWADKSNEISHQLQQDETIRDVVKVRTSPANIASGKRSRDELGGSDPGSIDHTSRHLKHASEGEK